MEQYSINKRDWYSIKDIVKKYSIVETRFFDYHHKKLFWEQVPEEYQGSFSKTKKKGYFASNSFDAIRYVEKDWFDLHKEDIFAKLERWHDEHTGIEKSTFL